VDWLAPFGAIPPRAGRPQADGRSRPSRELRCAARGLGPQRRSRP